MSCRRASEIDLAAYLVEPDAPRWADFRAHYPWCRDCSEEVGRWSRLEAQLSADRGRVPSGRHPDIEQLDRLDGDPELLAPEVRAEIERHLQECRACADEMAALKERDLGAIQAVGRDESPGWLSRFMSRVRQLLEDRGAMDEPMGAADRIVRLREPELALQSRPGLRHPDGATSHAPTPLPPYGILAVVGGPASGVVRPIHPGRSRIGRSSACEVHVPDPSLSRVAAELAVRQDGVHLSRASGRLEVRVNGAAVSDAMLEDGDLIEIGDMQLRFRIVEPGPDAAR